MQGAPYRRPHLDGRSAQVDELCVAYVAGAATAALARAYGVPRTTVGRHLGAEGIELTQATGSFSATDVPAGAARQRGGETLKEIAGTFGVDKETVRRRLLDADVRMSGMLGSAKDRDPESGYN